jgi:hypothetical protein
LRLAGGVAFLQFELEAKRIELGDSFKRLRQGLLFEALALGLELPDDLEWGSLPWSLSLPGAYADNRASRSAPFRSGAWTGQVL